jgi:hypothetical protein
MESTAAVFLHAPSQSALRGWKARDSNRRSEPSFSFKAASIRCSLYSRVRSGHH